MSETTTESGAHLDDAPVSRGAAASPWIGLVARLVLGGIFLVAGLLKLPHPQGNAESVRAYRLLPWGFSAYVGYALPVVEIIVALLLILGLFTRVAAVVVSLMLIAFIIGISSAWARGLTIDCGCFGGGGIVAKAQTQYPQRIVEDIGMLLCGLWLIARPRTALSLDRLLLGR